ncbi:MAG: hypothetical protein LBP67_08240 [Bacteroidales bacterium]|jgi:hypothetical protein|nr:hypothetical protein [Bacteroidales bacterium]
MKKIKAQKIRSGQPFCYRANGMNSTIIDVIIKEEVWGCYLTRALTQTIKRYPYFAGKLVEKNGDFYLADNTDISMIVRKKRFNRLGSMAAGYHLIEVSYDGTHIYVSFHHAICDGRGIQPFIETLIYYYFCIAKNKKFKAEHIRKSDSTMLDGETFEPFEQKYTVDDFVPPTVIRDGFALPECAHQRPDRSRQDIEIDEKAFIDFAKSVEATPVVLLSYLFSKSIVLNNEDIDKPIVTSVAADMRQELELPNTHKNCVRSIYLPFCATDKTAEIRKVCFDMRRALTEQRESNYVRAVANSFIDLSDKLDTMNSFDEKKVFMSFFDTMTINTYVVSYLGRFDFGECNDFVDAVFLLGGETGISLDMICAGGKFCVSIIQNIDGEKYIKTFLSFLDELKIIYKTEGIKPFFTKKDVTQKTGRWHAERYQKNYLSKNYN